MPADGVANDLAVHVCIGPEPCLGRPSIPVVSLGSPGGTNIAPSSVSKLAVRTVSSGSGFIAIADDSATAAVETTAGNAAL